MTEPITAPAEAIDQPTAPPEPTDTTEPLTPSREAAKYRTQLRATEGERDALMTTVTSLQQQIIEQIITDKVGVSPAGVFTVNSVADFLDESGQIDTARVIERANATATAIGLALAPRTPRPDPSQGAHETGAPEATWSGFFKGK